VKLDLNGKLFFASLMFGHKQQPEVLET